LAIFIRLRDYFAMTKKSGNKGGEIRLRGKRIASLDKGLAMVRTGRSIDGAVFVRRSDETEVMLRKAAKALTKPGISKLSIFKGRKSPGIFAYSADPKDASKVVQEAWDGTRRVGKAVGRKFKRA
jgi:hypothetical protein